MKTSASLKAAACCPPRHPQLWGAEQPASPWGVPTTALQRGSCSAPRIPAWLLINHSGCSGCRHCRRHLKTEDAVSSLLRNAFLPSLTAFKGKVCAAAQGYWFWPYKNVTKNCTAVLTEAASGSVMMTFWQSGHYNVCTRKTRYAKAHHNLCRVGPKIVSVSQPGTAWTHGSARLLREAQQLLSFSPWSTKLWEAKQKSEHLWGYFNLPLERDTFISSPPNAAERLRKQAVPFKLPTNIAAWQNAAYDTKGKVLFQ